MLTKLFSYDSLLHDTSIQILIHSEISLKVLYKRIFGCWVFWKYWDWNPRNSQNPNIKIYWKHHPTTSYHLHRSTALIFVFLYPFLLFWNSNPAYWKAIKIQRSWVTTMLQNINFYSSNNLISLQNSRWRHEASIQQKTLKY